MIICIENVVTGADLDWLRRQVGAANYQDGRNSAGWAAKLVKNTRQISQEDPRYRPICARIEGALGTNDILAAAALPKMFRSPVISRLTEGMGYGTHVDDALMGAPPIRTDLSYTLFLSDPDSYEGGELVIESAGGELPYKLGAGSMVLYPSTYLHRVDPVAAGERVVAAGWIQSFVSDAGRRELLFDLYRARNGVFAAMGKTEEFDLISRSFSNLMRSWSDL